MTTSLSFSTPFASRWGHLCIPDSAQQAIKLKWHKSICRNATFQAYVKEQLGSAFSENELELSLDRAKKDAPLYLHFWPKNDPCNVHTLSEKEYGSDSQLKKSIEELASPISAPLDQEFSSDPISAPQKPPLASPPEPKTPTTSQRKPMEATNFPEPKSPIAGPSSPTNGTTARIIEILMKREMQKDRLQAKRDAKLDQNLEKIVKVIEARNKQSDLKFTTSFRRFQKGTRPIFKHSSKSNSKRPPQLEIQTPKSPISLPTAAQNSEQSPSISLSKEPTLIPESPVFFSPLSPVPQNLETPLVTSQEQKESQTPINIAPQNSEQTPSSPSQEQTKIHPPLSPKRPKTVPQLPSQELVQVEPQFNLNPDSSNKPDSETGSYKLIELGGNTYELIGNRGFFALNGISTPQQSKETSPHS